MERTVATAWYSDRPYWMRLAACWAAEMVSLPHFDRKLMRSLLSEMESAGASASEERGTAQ
jgi:hypothetical protein